MSKTVIPLVMGLLLILLTVAQVTNLVKANPTYPPAPPMPDLNEPSIKIQLPEENKTYDVNIVPYSITVNKPSSWFDEYPVHGQILVIDYILDESQHVKIGDEPDYYKQGPFNFKGTLAGLSEGNHSLEVYIRSDSFYDPSNTTQPPYPPPHDYYLDTHSVKTNFAVDTTAPSISYLISVPNASYLVGEVPVGFVVSEPTSRIAYSFDGNDNVTIIGNFTLTNLPNGLHNVLLYAWDSAGNVGISEVATFTVDKQPEFTSNQESFQWLPVAAASATIVVIAILAALIYIKKRKQAPG